eukprot:1160922-Pelagomonas_calceolata.AAC.10
MDCSSSCKPPLTQVSAPCLGYEALSSPKCSNMQQTLCLDQGLLICRCVLQARKAYFQVRKQAEAKKWHMIHGETNTAPAGAINEGAANHGVFGRVCFTRILLLVQGIAMHHLSLHQMPIHRFLPCRKSSSGGQLRPKISQLLHAPCIGVP